jgi:hypothetical protein
MKSSIPINLEFNRKNLLALLALGAEPDKSPYSHKQIAEWCERFWNKYCYIDAPEDIEVIMPVLADVETQWDLYLAGKFSLSELKKQDFESVLLPVEWFVNWSTEANA